MKVIASYQQTFGTSTVTKSQSFTFQRVYKSNPDYKIMISVSNITLYQSGSSTISNLNEPRVLLLTGIPEINGKCNFQMVGDDNDVRNTNDYVLGVFSDIRSTLGTQPKSITIVPKTTSFIVNDLPLGKFNIRYEDTRGEEFTSVQPDALFVVSFLIDVVDTLS